MIQVLLLFLSTSAYGVEISPDCQSALQRGLVQDVVREGANPNSYEVLYRYNSRRGHKGDNSYNIGSLNSSPTEGREIAVNTDNGRFKINLDKNNCSFQPRENSDELVFHDTAQGIIDKLGAIDQIPLTSSIGRGLTSKPREEFQNAVLNAIRKCQGTGSTAFKQKITRMRNLILGGLPRPDDIQIRSVE